MKPIRKLQNTDTLPTPGIVFWWSNILRSFQIRVFTPQGEVTALSELHIDRQSVEAVAQRLAAAMNLDIFEIEIEQLDLHSLPVEPPPLNK